MNIMGPNDHDRTISECSQSWSTKMPHSFREKAQGRMVYLVPIIVFMDDVSGNISKQWNKHHVIYMSNGNMPREMIDKEFCVCFVSSSPHATPMELADAMRESIRCVYIISIAAKLRRFTQKAGRQLKTASRPGTASITKKFYSSHIPYYGQATIPCKPRNAVKADLHAISFVEHVKWAVQRNTNALKKALRAYSR